MAAMATRQFKRRRLNSPRDVAALSDDTDTALNDMLSLGDVVLTCKDAEVQCHSAILSVSSPFFRDLLDKGIERQASSRTAATEAKREIPVQVCEACNCDDEAGLQYKAV